MLELITPYLLPAAGAVGAGLIGWHGKGWIASAKAKEQQAQQWISANVSKAEGAVPSWLAHPVTGLRTVEHEMAQEAATIAANAIAHLSDSTAQDANIAVQNDIKAFKAQLLADALAKLQKPQ